MPSPTAIVLLHPNFEELEATAPIDILRRAGIEVCVASADDAATVTGRCGLTFGVDAPFSRVRDRLFDAFVLPGGPGVMRLRARTDIHDALRAHARAGKCLAAICAAPLLLKDAGVLGDAKRACHASVAAELAPVVDAPVVQDGRLITSQGAGTACAFGLKIAETLCGGETAREIARAIHF